MHCGFHGLPVVLSILGGLFLARFVVGGLLRRRFRGGECRSGFGAFGGRSPFGGQGFGGRWRAHGLRRVFQRLGTTVAQEKVIKDALSDLETSARGAKEEARATREKLGRAFASGTWGDVEEQTFDGDFDAVTSKMKDATKRALRSIFDVLDDEQKKVVAAWLERRGGLGRFGGGRGPYRGAAH